MLNVTIKVGERDNSSQRRSQLKRDQFGWSNLILHHSFPENFSVSKSVSKPRCNHDILQGCPFPEMARMTSRRFPLSRKGQGSNGFRQTQQPFFRFPKSEEPEVSPVSLGANTQEKYGENAFTVDQLRRRFEMRKTRVQRRVDDPLENISKRRRATKLQYIFFFFF